jgi:hypothetical protein
MSETADQSAMEQLHNTVAQELAKRITDGTATSSDMSNAIKFLKDNHIETAAGKNTAVNKLANSMPVFDDEVDGVVKIDFKRS